MLNSNDVIYVSKLLMHLQVGDSPAGDATMVGGALDYNLVRFLIAVHNNFHAL